MKISKTTGTILIIAGAVFLGFFAHAWHTKNDMLERPELQASKGEQRTSGIFEITTSYGEDDQFRGVVSHDDGKTIEVNILDYGLWWEVRINGDNNRVHTLYPKGQSPNKILDLGAAINSIEARIIPGQTIDGKLVTSAKCSYQIK